MLRHCVCSHNVVVSKVKITQSIVLAVNPVSHKEILRKRRIRTPPPNFRKSIQQFLHAVPSQRAPDAPAPQPIAHNPELFSGQRSSLAARGPRRPPPNARPALRLRPPQRAVRPQRRLQRLLGPGPSPSPASDAVSYSHFVILWLWLHSHAPFIFRSRHHTAAFVLSFAP